MANSSRLVNNIKYYTIGVFSTKILSFLLIPFYTSILLPEELGKFQYILSLISLIVPLIYESIWEGMFRFSIVNGTDGNRIINTSTKYSLGISVIYSILFLIAAYVFHLEYAGWILLCGILFYASSYWQYAARALSENKIYALSTFISSAVTIVANILFVIVFKWQIQALFLAQVLGNLAVVVVLELKLKLLLKLNDYPIDKKLLKDILKYSIPLAINSVSWWLLSSCNNIVVTKVLGEYYNGIMAIAQRFAGIFALVTTIISMAWQEESFRTLQNENRTLYFNKVLKTYIRLLFSAVIILIPTSYILYHFFIKGEYNNGAPYTAILYVIAAYNAIVTHLGSEFLARGDSKILFWTTLVSGLITLLLSIILVRPFGVIGVLIATFISCVVNYIIRVVILKKSMEIEPNMISIIILTASSIVMLFACELWKDELALLFFVTFLSIIPAFIMNNEIINKLVRNLLHK